MILAVGDTEPSEALDIEAHARNAGSSETLLVSPVSCEKMALPEDWPSSTSESEERIGGSHAEEVTVLCVAAGTGLKSLGGKDENHDTSEVL